MLKDVTLAHMEECLLHTLTKQLLFSRAIASALHAVAGHSPGRRRPSTSVRPDGAAARTSRGAVAFVSVTGEVSEAGRKRTLRKPRLGSAA